MTATRPGEPAREVVPWGHAEPQWPLPLQFVPVGPANRDLFWQMVQERRLARWEQLDAAILGVGIVGNGSPVTVYSYRKALHILGGLVEAGEQRWFEIEEFFNATIGSVNFGPTTPYFVHV